MSKYPEDKVFGEWTPEQQREFKIDTLIDGKRWEAKMVASKVGWITKDRASLPSYAPDVYYRLAPEPEIPDSIDWSHVHPDAVGMNRAIDWDYALFFNEGEAVVGYTNAHASYKRGNMESCTVYRPGFDSEEKAK
ncbi:hypothetical protein [Robbsia andropogonis]|uniref:hypothetical protein n=1 Tax=Robbsia andropogonis TaxID=28092 RepID=UPI00209CD5CB|nr:hypothetical protein [Robbsia andropogonis]MCP1118883.1 hypothetical protein [Robbsia andropogonis]MCP1128350.1 hypothetical protein [Robbsia andropogonis]